MENRRAGASKNCSGCKQSKTLAEYHIRVHGNKYKAQDPRKYASRCKECRKNDYINARGNDWRPKRNPRAAPNSQTPEEKRAVEAAYKRRKRRKTRIKALQYLASKGCETCGERDPRVLEFDHRDPKKKSENISVLLGNGYGWGTEKLRAEIRKCRVLCVKCHTLHTVEQMEYYAHDDVQSALREIYDNYDITE